MKTHRFTATIEAGRGGGAFVVVPLDVPKVFTTRGRVKVRVTFDGIPYRGSMVPMGGKHVVGILQDIRAALGKDVGDPVRVELVEDTEERTVEIPSAFRQALKERPAAKKRFDRLSYTRRREYAEAISGAKKPETRDRRLAAILAELSAE